MDTRIYLYQELMEADLHQIIRSGQALSDAHYQSFIYQICCGLKYIHSANVLHRDLKPGNLLVNADCDLKICDFGLARGYVDMPGADSGFMTEYVATRWYRAPEIMLSFQSYTKASEVGENDTERSICGPWDAFSLNCWVENHCSRAEIVRTLFLSSWRLFMILTRLCCSDKGVSLKSVGFRIDCPHPPPLNITFRLEPLDVDQLNQILYVLGTPDDPTLKRVGSERAQIYIRSLQRFPKVPFSQLYPQATPGALDLLERLLTFDPAARITVEEALEHPYLSLFHDPEDEPSHLQTCDFSFESLQTMEEMKEAIVAEVRSFKSKKHKLARLDMGFRRTNSNLTTPTPDRVRFDQDVGAQDDHGYAADLIASPMEVDPGLERELSGAGAH
ncbi:hypothetical protein BC936DRAFT_144673 [Jimgerdemannia flammicorona]|uniref:Protein kinase domain-containing protein n=1 Tax=Jimgerdemannia flammicorona TaxID=994334 RepID=A0A433DBZ3_9FUNG|nr:hypothetical protein BC936DRAFT_144673 [Jimgerdemannia flammicorona]